MSVRQQAGLMRERITLQTSTGFTRSPEGEPVRSWSSIATVWAQVITAANARESVGAQDNVSIPVTFRIRHRSDVDTKHRILWPTTSNILDIESAIDVDGLGKILELTAVEHA